MLSFIQRHFLLPIGAFIWVVPFLFLVSIIVVIFAICIFNLELIQCFLFSQRHHHLVKAHSTTTLICDECSMTFVDKNDLKKHKKGVHTTELLYCSFCDFSTKLAYSLKRHTQSKHKKMEGNKMELTEEGT